MTNSTLAYCSKAPRADFIRACRINRIIKNHALSGYDPEDCVVANPRTGEPMRLEVRPMINHIASYAADIIINRGFDDHLAMRKPGNVLRAMAAMRIPDPFANYYEDFFADIFADQPSTRKSDAKHALEVTRAAESRQ